MKKRLSGEKYIVGIDEAGRGPIAGPLAVGLVLFNKGQYEKYKRRHSSLPKGTDSKKLTENERERFFSQIKQMNAAGELRYFVSMVSNNFLDKFGLTKAWTVAIKKGLKILRVSSKTTLILLDGGLRAPANYKQKTIIKGDEKEKIIGLASIAAKVERDAYMKRMAKKYPGYAFERHKGYGTSEHYRLLSKNGISTIHRKTFISDLQKVNLPD
jgi:ribonuclease HII